MREVTIIYEVKEKLGLSLSEYVVTELFYRASGASRRPSPFPCQASKAALAKYLGMSKSGVFRIIERLVKKGMLLKGKGIGRGYLTPADVWYKTIEVYGEKENESKES